ncbi:hypothetical protein HDU91_000872 [Kappamyces sp. JEL0680]|nr:hypothetical protein HDU91_000872 [Kappamyces sp. JEL0680]
MAQGSRDAQKEALEFLDSLEKIGKEDGSVPAKPPTPTSHDPSRFASRPQTLPAPDSTVIPRSPPKPKSRHVYAAVGQTAPAGLPQGPTVDDAPTAAVAGPPPVPSVPVSLGIAEGSTRLGGDRRHSHGMHASMPDGVIPGFDAFGLGLPLSQPAHSDAAYNPSTVADPVPAHPTPHTETAPAQTPDQGGSWSWGSLLTSAQKGLQTAKTIAGSTVETLQKSETVKGIYTNVAPELVKISSAAKSTIGTFGDTLVPPISASAAGALFPGNLSVWMCLSYHSGISERLARASRQASREMWNGTVCGDTAVNIVDDANFQIVSGSAEAIQTAERTMEKLGKLAEGQGGPAGVHAFLCIQPFVVELSSGLMEQTSHLQFYCTLVCDAPSGLLNASCLSQSVCVSRGDDAWHQEWAARVLETALPDLFEEFAKFSK